MKSAYITSRSESDRRARQIAREEVERQKAEFCPDCMANMERQTISAELVKHGKWTDDTTDVVCSNCKSEFNYEMLIFIARGIKSKHVDGMTCRCPKCGSYNIYGGEQDAAN